VAELDESAAQIVRDARGTISQAVSMLQQLNARDLANGVTLESSLIDAVYEIDSAPDTVDPYLDSSYGLAEAEADAGQAFTVGILQTPRRVGRLQRIRDLKVALFGGSVRVVSEEGAVTTEKIGGLIEQLKNVPTGSAEIG
jgi:hypothetical protein